MSLTSYRAAPPCNKICGFKQEQWFEEATENADVASM